MKSNCDSPLDAATVSVPDRQSGMDYRVPSGTELKVLSQRIGWLNKNVGLRRPICFDQVVGPWTKLHIDTGTGILSDLQSAAAVILLAVGFGLRALYGVPNPTCLRV